LKAGKTFNEIINAEGGTILYQAPEQLTCKSYSKYIDIWAVGLILYEIVTGVYLFDSLRSLSKPEFCYAI